MKFSTDEKIYTFVNFPLGCVTCVQLVISILVITRMKDPSPIFAYLRLDQVFTLTDSLIYSIGLISKCSACFPTINPVFTCWYKFYLLNFFSSVVEMCSILTSILAALAYLSSIEANQNKHSWLLKHFSRVDTRLMGFIVFILSTFTFSYELSVSIPSYQPPLNNSATYDFKCVWIDYFSSPPNSVFLIVSFLISYFFLAIALVVVNGFIVHRFRQSLDNNSLLVLKNSAYRRKTAEQKLTKLVVADCCNLFLGRSPTLVYFIVDLFFDLGKIDFPFMSLTIFFIILSYNLKFFIFYKLNHKFKRESKRILICFIKCESKQSSINSNLHDITTRSSHLPPKS